MSTQVIVVDWLGRGGIAQTADAWARVLRAQGAAVRLLTRTGRELSGPNVAGVREPRYGGAALWHLHLVVHVVRRVLRGRPAAVILQNYHQPLLELAVVAAARLVRARVVIVVHNHEPHGRWFERGVGLRYLVGAADRVICHSRFVADRLPVAGAQVIPHPKALSVLSSTATHAPVAKRPRCLQFGISRSYKGEELIERLAAMEPGWEFRQIGAGVGRTTPLVSRRDEFLSPGELVGELHSASVAIFPYRSATQSGGVALAHALGVVPIAAAVGGIPEQIHDGEDGFLVPSEATVLDWLRVLRLVNDESLRCRLAQVGRQRAEREHVAFENAVSAMMLDVADLEARSS
ncbi:MAG: glycosyltransferase family 4 protein [Acidimicrobiia bacterium]